MEKTDRAVELFLKYHRQVQAAGDAAAMPQDDDDEFGMDPEEARFLRRLDAGLFSLQVCARGSRAVCPCYQPCLLCVVCAPVWWSWRVVPTRISVRRTPWQACSLQPARFGWLCRPHAKHNALSRSDLCCLWWSQLRYHVGMKLREQGGSLVDLYTSLTGITLSPYSAALAPPLG